MDVAANIPRSRRPSEPRKGGNPKARDLVNYFVGQGVGLVDSVKSTREVVREFMEDFAEALADMQALMDE